MEGMGFNFKSEVKEFDPITLLSFLGDKESKNGNGDITSPLILVEMTKLHKNMYLGIYLFQDILGKINNNMVSIWRLCRNIIGGYRTQHAWFIFTGGKF
jgi:hypothetical protein